MAWKGNMMISGEEMLVVGGLLLVLWVLFGPS